MHKYSIKTTIALVAAVSIQSLSFSGWAQTTPITINDVVASIDTSWLVQAAEQQVVAAQSEVKVARAGHMPTPIFAVGPQLTNGAEQTAVSLSVVQPLFTGHVVSNQIVSAKHLVNSADHNLDWVRAQAKANIKVYYYEIQKAIKTKAAQLQAVAASTRYMQEAQKDLDLGLTGNAGDLEAAVAALETANSAVSTAQNAFDTNCDGLLHMLRKGNSERSLCSNLVDTDPPVQPTLTEQQAEDYAVQNRPDLQSQREVIESNKATVKTFNVISGLTAGLQVSDTRNSGIGGAGSATNIDSTGLPAGSGTGNDFRVGVNVQYKWDPARKGNRENALAVQHQNEDALNEAMNTVKNQVQDAYANLSLAYQLSAQYDKEYTAQKLELAISKKKLDLGQLPSLLYVQVIAATAAAQAAHLTALITVREAINQVQLALGQVTASDVVASSNLSSSSDQNTMKTTSRNDLPF